MTGIAMAMVLAAACLHAGWNYLAKKSLNKIVFIWWFNLASVILYLPMFMYFWPKTSISTQGWCILAATGGLHFLYFWFLGKAYEHGDLSLVYPISRGFGPLLVPILAAITIKENLPLAGLFSIALVIFGQYVIHLRSFSTGALLDPFRHGSRHTIFWSFCTGVTIAGYSIVDKIGVGLIEPPVYIYLMFILTLVLLTPVVCAAGRKPLLLEWRTNRFTIVAAGAIVLGTYLIVLFAFQVAKVSYVVTVRETSIVFSVFYGIYRLQEKYGRQRLLGAGLIALGVTGIGLAG